MATMSSLLSSHSHSQRKPQDDSNWSILNEDTQEDEEEDDLESRSGSPPPAPLMVPREPSVDSDDMIEDDEEMILDKEEEPSMSQVVRSNGPATWFRASQAYQASPQYPPQQNIRVSSTQQSIRVSSSTRHAGSFRHISTPVAGPSASSAEEDDEDDARIMARLMAQHHERQTGAKKVVQSQESQNARAARGLEDQESSMKARLFLEGLCLDFLNQLYVSEKIIASRTRDKFRGNGKKGSKGKKAQGSDSEDEVVEGEVGVRISLKNRKTGGNHTVSFPDDATRWTETQPGSGMLQIARILCVASLLYEACVTGVTTTKRDIYYKDVRLFGTQAVVDQLVDDIVATAGLKRKHFNVCAASKGLMVSACLEICLKSGDKLTCSGSSPALIPSVERIERIDSTTPPEWVLIVEKDAVFQPLCGMRLLEDVRLGPGVIVTGKGYPDLATLQLLALIADHYPSTKFYGLFDADPHGLDILSVYAHGSQSSRFSHDHSDLPLRDRLEWIGVKASEFLKIGVKHDDLLPLSEKDVQKANAMLRDPMLRPDCQRELVHMLHLNRKAEIQVILGASPDTDESMEWNEGGPGMLLDYIVTRMTG